MKSIIFILYSFIFSIFIRVHKKGKNSIVKFPFKMWNPQYISLGNQVFIAENSYFAISDQNHGKKYTPQVIIGNNVCIGSNFFIACIQEVKIEDDVLISDRVFISDHIHNYGITHIPIIKQPLLPKGKVLIKKGAFIGINVVVMPGVTIGKNSVVGASSVVVKDVPDYTVVAGNPAKNIKQYNQAKKKWEKVK